MSHNKERKEKICLNCNAHLTGRFCHICGQENIEVKQTFWHLVTHFVYDITHFDGKFFDTLKYLLFRPGYLSHEYLRGRRNSYLDPIRMYVFTSAIFFLIFFTFIHNSKIIAEDAGKVNSVHLFQEKLELQGKLNSLTDSLEKQQVRKSLDSLDQVISQLGLDTSLATIKGRSQGLTEKTDTTPVTFQGMQLPTSVREYDSIQRTIPDNKRDGWLLSIIRRREILIKQKYEVDKAGFFQTITDKFFHSFPQMMFISLPLAAIIFQLLFIRRRKQFYYVNHGIFIIHLYIAFYIFILLYYLFSGFQQLTGIVLFDWLQTLLVLLSFFYMYKAMRNFYGQARLKTLFKMFLFNFVYLFVIIFLMIIFFISSLLQV